MGWTHLFRQSEKHEFLGSDIAGKDDLVARFSRRSDKCGPPFGQDRIDDPHQLLNCSSVFGPWEFHENPDLITFGCSVTAGQGLLRRFTWPSLAQEIFGLRVNNASRAGSSVAFQLTAVTEIIERYGAPPRILGLLPNLDRAWIPRTFRENGELFVSGESMSYAPELQTFITLRDLALYRFFKSDHRIQARTAKVAPQLIIWYTLQMLDHWETLLDLAGIELGLGSWYRGTNDSLAGLFPTLILPSYEEWEEADWRADQRYGDPYSDSCGHTPQNEEQKDYWTIGDDNLHPGLHFQIHFCETLLQTQISNADLRGL